MKAFAGLFPPLLVGAIAFVLITGGTILAPTYVDWLMRGGDSAQHWLGWQFFRQSPLLQWPLGANPSYGMELGSSIVFSDSIPLLALAFKPFSSILPATFQYIGLWIFACFVLQSYFAWKLLGLFTANRWLRLLGCAFFLIAPTWLWRLRGHHALFAQWTLLAALLLYFSPKFSARRWIVLLAATALIHAYLLAMVLAIYLTDLAQRRWSRRLPVTAAFRHALLTGLSVGAVMWAAGYFMLGTDAGPGGFGIYRMHLLSLIDPDEIWSALLPNWDQQPGEYEGFNFMGSGMLGLGLTAALVAAWKKGTGGAKSPTGERPVTSSLRAGSSTSFRDMAPRIVPILALSVLLSCYAISNHVAIGGQELWSYQLPAMAQPLADAFRSSGRFFWPVYYLAYLAIFHLLFTRLSARSAASICIVALTLQAVDSNGARDWYNARFARAPAWSSPMRSPMWDSLASRYRNVVVVLPHNGSPQWKPLSRFAADHGMTINTGYFARIDREREQDARRRVAASIMEGSLDAGSLYIFQDDGLWQLALSQVRPTDVAGMLDGFRIIAPHLGACAGCDLIATATVAIGDDGDYRYGAGRVLFSTSGLGHKYTVHGWSQPEDWGTWSDGDTAYLRFDFSDPPEGDIQLLIEGHAFLAEGHPLQEVDVSVNGRYLQTLTYNLSYNYGTRVVRIARELVIGNSGRLLIGFALRNAKSPADLKLSNDSRRLGLGVMAIELSCLQGCGEQRVVFE